MHLHKKSYSEFRWNVISARCEGQDDNCGIDVKHPLNDLYRIYDKHFGYISHLIVFSQRSKLYMQDHVSKSNKENTQCKNNSKRS